MDSNSNSSIVKWLPLLFGLVMALGVLIGFKLNEDIAVKENTLTGFGGKSKLNEVVQYINAKYVDDVDVSLLEEDAIKSVLTQLDPHSSYIDPEHLITVSEHMKGNFKGVGIEFIILKDTIYILSVVAGGPSEKAGLQAGDKVVEISDSIVAGVNISNEDIIKYLRGEAGSKVQVKIKRANEATLLPFEIIRDNIPIHSLDAAYRINESTVYIKLSRFSSTTYTEFAKALEDLLENMEEEVNLVLDLRQNPGGYLGEAIKILNQIIEKRNQLLVYTKGEKQQLREYNTNGPVFFNIKDVVVLVDEGSASASEIVAGAIQDLDAGIIVGRRTFGKGLVQEEYPLSGKAALRLTVARYYTPSNRLIQKPYSDTIDYDSDLKNRYLNGEYSSQDSVALIDSTEYTTKNGRIVYGKGGISPDIFIAEKKIYSDEQFEKVSGSIPTFCYGIFPEQFANRKDLKLEDFIQQPLEKNVLLSYQKYLEKEGELQWTELSTTAQQELSLLMKIYLGRQIFGQEGAVQIRNAKDAAFVKALQLIDKKEIEELLIVEKK